MQQFKLESSPIVYYISGKDCSEWVLFLHAAFVNHKMFQPQIEYFESKYNILTVDIIGHGKSTDTNKGDCLEKMSVWIHDIMNAEKIKNRRYLVGCCFSTGFRKSVSRCCKLSCLFRRI